MKRSEMIEKIYDQLYQVQLAPDWAEQILDCVEGLGMVPPFDSDVYIKSHNKFGYGLANGNEWKEEDGY